MLESIKDENGQIKKPILFSLIGGAGLVGYLLLKGSGSSSGTASTGQSSDLSTQLAALQDAITGLAGSGGTGSGTGSTSLDPPVLKPPIIVLPGTQPPAGGITQIGTPTSGSRTSSGGSTTTKQQGALAPVSLGTVVSSGTGGTGQAARRPAIAQLTPTGPIAILPAATAGENGVSGGGGQGLITVPTAASVIGASYGGIAAILANPIAAIVGGKVPATAKTTTVAIKGGAAAVRTLPKATPKVTPGLQAVIKNPIAAIISGKTATVVPKGGVSTPIAGGSGGVKLS